jgi:hypothetical protein
MTVARIKIAHYLQGYEDGKSGNPQRFSLADRVAMIRMMMMMIMMMIRRATNPLPLEIRQPRRRLREPRILMKEMLPEEKVPRPQAVEMGTYRRMPLPRCQVLPLFLQGR